MCGGGSRRIWFPRSTDSIHEMHDRMCTPLALRQIADFGIFAFGVGLAPHVRSPTSAAIETSTHTRTVRILLAKNLTAPYRRIARLTLRDRGNSQQIQAHKHKPSSMVELHFFFRLLPQSPHCRRGT